MASQCHATFIRRRSKHCEINGAMPASEFRQTARAALHLHHTHHIPHTPSNHPIQTQMHLSCRCHYCAASALPHVLFAQHSSISPCTHICGEWARALTVTAEINISNGLYYCKLDSLFFVFVSQGWTPVSDRSGGGRRSILSGSGGRHHWAHPPLYPGSCSQHLQCHADEPQLCRADTGAVQLAAPPPQVKNRSEIRELIWNLQEKKTYNRSCLSLSGPSQTPPPLSWRRPVSDRARGCVLVERFLLADSSGKYPSSLRRLALQESAHPDQEEDGGVVWLVTHDAVCSPEPFLWAKRHRLLSLKTLKFTNVSATWTNNITLGFLIWMTEMLMRKSSSLRTRCLNWFCNI